MHKLKRRLAKLSAIEGIRGVMADYGRTHSTTPQNLVVESAGHPVFRAMNRQPRPLNPVGGANLNLPVGLTFRPFGKQKAVDFAIEEIRRWTPAERPAFIHVSLANWLTEMAMAIEIAKGLGPQYLAVRPDQLVALYKQRS